MPLPLGSRILETERGTDSTRVQDGSKARGLVEGKAEKFGVVLRERFKIIVEGLDFGGCPRPHGSPAGEGRGHVLRLPCFPPFSEHRKMSPSNPTISAVTS